LSQKNYLAIWLVFGHLRAGYQVLRLGSNPSPYYGNSRLGSNPSAYFFGFVKPSSLCQIKKNS